MDFCTKISLSSFLVVLVLVIIALVLSIGVDWNKPWLLETYGVTVDLVTPYSNISQKFHIKSSCGANVVDLHNGWFYWIFGETKLSCAGCKDIPNALMFINHPVNQTIKKMYYEDNGKGEVVVLFCFLKY